MSCVGIGQYTPGTDSIERQYPKLIHEIKLESMKKVNNTSRLPYFFFCSKAYSLRICLCREIKPDKDTGNEIYSLFVI